MITVVQEGDYKLIETKHNTKVLYLDKKIFAWIEPEGIGEILVTSRKHHRTDCILSVGEYRMYKVEDEPTISDHLHLELEVGKNIWQGYLLLTNLPDQTHPKTRIIPTSEVITNNPGHADKYKLHQHLLSSM